ncbi:MAG: TAXI family TRAP transporter solute-binding subunit [Acetobacteraceae bacterium]
MSNVDGARPPPNAPGASLRRLKQPFRSSRRGLVLTGFVAALLAVLCLWVTLRFIDPIPPRRIVLASGPSTGLYHQFAERYKAALAAEGVILEERMTDGAAENYRLLLDPKSGVDLALIQGGVAAFPEANSLVMIASLYYEPLWIFTRRGEAADALSAFAGKRILIGSPGSGTNMLATQLLRASGVTAENATLLSIPTRRAVSALKEREIDVAMIVTGPRGAALHAALTDPDLELVGLAQADAYPQRLTFITRRTLHAGAIDFVPLIPPRDTALLATKAMLVARDTVHPAIVNLLLEVIRDVHNDRGFFEAPNEFPNIDLVDIPVSPDAVRHSRFGPSLLYRYLPFWVATVLERFIIIVVPLLVILLPPLRFLPQIADWRVRRRIYRWYGQLIVLEHDVQAREGELPLKQWLSDLDGIERAVEHTRIPESFASEVYTLREHIDLVRRAVLAKSPAASPTAAPIR